MKDWFSLSSLREMKTSLLSGYEFDHVSSRRMKIIVAAGKLGFLDDKMQVMLAEPLLEQTLIFAFLCDFPVTYIRNLCFKVVS